MNIETTQTPEDAAIEMSLPLELWGADTHTYRATRRLAARWAAGQSVRDFVRKQVAAEVEVPPFNLCDSMMQPRCSKHPNCYCVTKTI